MTADTTFHHKSSYDNVDNGGELRQWERSEEPAPGLACTIGGNRLHNRRQRFRAMKHQDRRGAKDFHHDVLARQ